MARGRGRRRGSGDGGRRSGRGHLQPELAAPGDAGEYYLQSEAERYHRVPKAARVQAELTHSAVALGALLPLRPASVVLDLGAGGGLSTLTFQALAADAAEVGGPPFIIGFDTSAPMLATASDLQESSLLGIRVPVPSPGSQASDSQIHSAAKLGLRGATIDPDTRYADVSSGIRWVAQRGDRVLADMSQPLPLRRGVADAVLSVSAVQWLVESRAASATVAVASKNGEAAGADNQDSTTQFTPTSVLQPKLSRLFSSLRSITSPGARLAMQFYPPKGDHDFGARALQQAVQAEGFGWAEVVLDFPHHPSSTAKKWILVSARDSEAQLTDIAADETPKKWCALCWPVVTACCALQADSCPDVLRRRAEHQHAEVALRLLRCGRRFRTSEAPAEGADGTMPVDVRERLRQQLHPLQLELAVALAEALDAGHAEEEVVELGQADEEVQEAKRRARGEERETKTELRITVEARLPELLEVLHRAPSKRWSLPPPPLSEVSTEADGSQLDRRCVESDGV